MKGENLDRSTHRTLTAKRGKKIRDDVMRSDLLENYTVCWNDGDG